MPHSFSIVRETGIVAVSFDSAPDLATLIEVAAALIEGHGDDRVFLGNFSNGVALEPTELREIAEGSKALAESRGRIVALVAPENLHYGLMRMFAVYREQDGSEVAVFRERAAAEQWLSGFLESSAQ